MEKLKISEVGGEKEIEFNIEIWIVITVYEA